MNPEVKQLWLDALRSGEYKQGRHKLKNTYEGSDNYCCLGVLCDLYTKENPTAKWTQNWQDDWYFNVDADSVSGTLPGAVMRWSGIADANPIVCYENTEESLATLNDRGVPFVEIANIIEKQL